MTSNRSITAPSLLGTVRDCLRERTGSETASVTRIDVGENHVLVAVDDDRLAGIAHRPSTGVPTVDTTDERDAFELASWAVDPPATTGEEAIGRRAVGVATLNALSVPHVDWRRGNPMTSLSEDVDAVATVGFFRPALDRFGPVDLRVVERDPIDETEVDAPDGVSVSTYLPDGAEEAFAGAEVIFVTGSAFVYGGAGRYLELADDDASVVVIGATSSFLPSPLFAAGADIVAGTRVTDSQAVSGIINGDVCTTDLYDVGLEKVYVSADGTVDGLRLDVARS